VAVNLDALLILLAARDPPPRWGLVDRMLVTAERSDLAAAIGVNKVDQLEAGSAGETELEAVAALYRGLGYPVFLFSALEGTGLDELRSWLGVRTVVVSGHSGVGKSTLLNALCPGLAAPMGELNSVTGKGRHTTTATVLHKLPSGGRVIDTPGFREFFPVDITPPELGRSYPELRAVLGGCRFGDCLHQGEPGCAVRAAVEAGAISAQRYEQYLQILSTLLELR
jgi:ribosome biogenesis GTPase